MMTLPPFSPMRTKLSVHRRCVAAAGMVLAVAVLGGCGRAAVRSAAEPAAEPAHAVHDTISFHVEQTAIPSMIPSAERGRPLYEQHCASCHGDSGEATRQARGAPDFSTTDWIRDKLPMELHEFIVDGPGHAFDDQLSLQDEWDVQAYVRFLGVDHEYLRTASTEVYGQHCNVCHGNKGYGNGFLAPTMQPKPRNLTDWEEWGNLRTDREIWENIWYGVHWSAMPPWRNVLTEDQIWMAVDFVRSQQYEQPAEEDSPAADTAADTMTDTAAEATGEMTE